MSTVFVLVRRNALLLVTLCASLFVFFRMTLPAIERHAALDQRGAEIEHERDDLRHQQAVSEAWLDAIGSHDPAAMTRLVFNRLQPEFVPFAMQDASPPASPIVPRRR